MGEMENPTKPAKKAQEPDGWKLPRNELRASLRFALGFSWFASGSGFLWVSSDSSKAGSRVSIRTGERAPLGGHHLGGDSGSHGPTLACRLNPKCSGMERKLLECVAKALWKATVGRHPFRTAVHNPGMI